FFTLHAIATMLFDSVSFKNIISNGLVLDKSGNKMSKRLGNAVDPFSTIKKHGSDPLRWYMISNAQPWDNLKFDGSGIDEVKRKFFGTLYNTYSFFALYANVDGFTYGAGEVRVEERPEIDRWIISLLNTLIEDVKSEYENYEPTRAARLIQDFVTENLSNWYVRLNRKRYWGGEFDSDKRAAYQTLYICLETVAMLAAPIAPFYMDKLFGDLNRVTGRHAEESVHLTQFPEYSEALIDASLEARMDVAQKLSSMILGLRRRVNIKVRQPLNRIMIPKPDKLFQMQVEGVKSLVLNEVNVKEIEYITDTAGILVKRIKPNFKALGPRFGKLMKEIGAAINGMDQEQIAAFEKQQSFEILVGGKKIGLTLEDVEIVSEDIPGWLVANEGAITVALDINITKELRQEGVARELINRIQNIRKESGFDVTDKIHVLIEKHELINDAIGIHGKYIGSQTLADSVLLTDQIENNHSKRIDIDDDVYINIRVSRV
ncbi:MAG: class I tRNA ligase family protein, partial [Bacteroidales bacterium]|nr:class I tRNA ligase family protein [Bacteroidales bacterium]